MITHKHHIVPRHAGGTDDKSNLVELTVEEHADAHRKLYEQYGRQGDYIAWKALSGQISGAEAQRLAVKYRDTSYMKTPEWGMAMSKNVQGVWDSGKRKKIDRLKVTKYVVPNTKDYRARERTDTPKDWHSSGPSK